MLLLRGATRVYPRRYNRPQFQYMLLLRGATERLNHVKVGYKVSIHAPLARSNRTKAAAEFNGMFQYMLLLRGATSSRGFPLLNYTSFNTCSSCEEQQHRPARPQAFCVSIHAPLARSNIEMEGLQHGSLVSIHAPLARSNVPSMPPITAAPFQYMLLLRGATHSAPR